MSCTVRTVNVEPFFPADSLLVEHSRTGAPCMEKVTKDEEEATMTEKLSFELRTCDRPNRFQVNPVNSGATRAKNTIDGSETAEDDTFNDDEITLRNKRRSSR